MSRSDLLVLVALAACAGGGEQGQPSGITLGDGSDSVADTDVVTTGGPADSTSGETTGSDPSASTTTAAGPTTGSTTNVDASGSSGAVDSSSSTGGDAVSWHRYSLDTVSGAWSQVPLSEIWVGGNAPPPTGITAATSLTHFDRLFVISQDQIVYEQADGVWQTPQPLDRRFPAAAGLNIDAMVHAPNQDTNDREGIFLTDTPVTVVYTQLENGGLVLDNVVDQVDNKGGAPQGSVDNVWTIGRTDPTLIDSEHTDWLVWHLGFADGELWRFSEALDWASSPVEDNVYFTGAAGEPDPFSVEAAYYDDVFERAHFIAP